MPAKRAPLRQAATAWREAAERRALEEALLQLPPATTLPAYVHASVAAVMAHKVDWHRRKPHDVSQTTLGSSQPSRAANGCDSPPSWVDAAAGHLQASLSPIPPTHTPFAAALMHSYLFLSTQPVRAHLEKCWPAASGGLVDDLATASTWSLSAGEYGALVVALGMQPLMAEALTWVGALGAESRAALGSLVKELTDARPDMASTDTASTAVPGGQEMSGRLHGLTAASHLPWAVGGQSEQHAAALQLAAAPLALAPLGLGTGSDGPTAAVHRSLQALHLPSEALLSDMAATVLQLQKHLASVREAQADNGTAGILKIPEDSVTEQQQGVADADIRPEADQSEAEPSQPAAGQAHPDVDDTPELHTGGQPLADAARSPPAVLSCSDVWQQHALGWACGLLTPGMPSCWPALRLVLEDSSTGTAWWGPLPVAVALLCMAAGASENSWQGTTQGPGEQERAAASNGCSATEAAAPLSPTRPPPAALVDVLVRAAAEAMRDVTDARQQALLQTCVATDAHLSRFRTSIQQDPRYVSSARASLVAASNRMAAQREHAGGVVLSPAAEAALASAAAAELLPFTVLMPVLLMERLVADAVHSPGQLPAVLGLLSGACRAAALGPVQRQQCTPDQACQVLAASDLGKTINSSAVVAPASSSPLMVALARVIRHSRQEASTDTARRGLLALLSGLMTSAGQGSRPSGAAVTPGSRGGLFTVLEMLSGVVVPLLEEKHADTQPRTLLASCQLLLCGPERTNTLPHQAGLIEHASPSLNILSSSHKEGGVMVARALLGVASLLQGLHGEAAQGSPDAGTIDAAAHLVDTLSQAFLHALGRSSTAGDAGSHLPAVPPAAHAAASHLMAAALSGALARPLLFMLLPVLERCSSALLHQQQEPGAQAGQGPSANAGPATTAAASAADLTQLLLPRAMWRPAGSASQGGAQSLLQQQLCEALWFAVSTPQHARLLLECAVSAWQEQVEELRDEEEGHVGGSVPGRSSAATAEAVLSQLTALCGPHHAATAGPTARSVARTMQRALSRTPEQALHSELPRALAPLLPLLSAEQAARLGAQLQPQGLHRQGGWGLAAAACLVAGDGKWLASWAEATAGVWADKAAAADGATSGQSSTPDAQLKHIILEAFSPVAAAASTLHQRQDGGNCLAAYTVHMMCSSLLHLTATSPSSSSGQQLGLERGAQHVAAGVRPLLEQHAVQGSGASTPAAVTHWAQACACLLEVVACAGQLHQQCGHVPPLLRVAAIAALSVVCSPLSMTRASSSTSPQQLAVGVLGGSSGLQAAAIKALGGVLRLSQAQDLVSALHLAALQLLEANGSREQGQEEGEERSIDFEQLLEA